MRFEFSLLFRSAHDFSLIVVIFSVFKSFILIKRNVIILIIITTNEIINDKFNAELCATFVSHNVSMTIVELKCSRAMKGSKTESERVRE